jgi:DNA-directed RNA polymerase subunit alpha
MAEFIKPQVTVEQVTDTLARFIMEPLERGYGYTLGNSIRRVLLSSLSGAAVTAIQIDGAQHEFMALDGVIEDITDIVLNVKGLIFKADDTADDIVAELSYIGEGTVTGADIKLPLPYTLVNPEHVIANLASGGKLEMTFRIGVGRGYVSAERNKSADDPIGVIHVDSLFSPVRRCAMDVSDTRRGQKTDYDRLVLEIETNGAVSPTEAICSAANIINQHMSAFSVLSDTEEDPEKESIFAPEGQVKNSELDKQVEDLDLSVRSYNCLKRAAIHTVQELVEYSENDLLNIRNFGAKSIEEVKDKLQTMGLGLKP